MTESQIERIRKAEAAMLELVKAAAQLRSEFETVPADDPETQKELLETIESLEAQAEDLRNSLREWREDLH